MDESTRDEVNAFRRKIVAELNVTPCGPWQDREVLSRLVEHLIGRVEVVELRVTPRAIKVFVHPFGPLGAVPSALSPANLQTLQAQLVSELTDLAKAPPRTPGVRGPQVVLPHRTEAVSEAIAETKRVIHERWSKLSEHRQRLVYLRAGRRVLPISQAYFPLLSYPLQALTYAELALCHPGAANPARVALFDAYKANAPCMRPAQELDPSGGLEEYYRRLAAIYANEACLHAASWNLTAQYLSYAENAAFIDGEVGALTEVRAQLSDVDEILAHAAAPEGA